MSLLLALQVVAPPLGAPVSPGGGHKQLPRAPFTLYRLPQHTELRAWEEQDQFGALVVTQREPAAAAFAQVTQFAAFAEAAEFGPLAANAIYRSSLADFAEPDEMPAVSARRGLPPLAVLTWFLDRME